MTTTDTEFEENYDFDSDSAEMQLARILRILETLPGHMDTDVILGMLLDFRTGLTDDVAAFVDSDAVTENVNKLMAELEADIEPIDIADVLANIGYKIDNGELIPND